MTTKIVITVTIPVILIIKIIMIIIIVIITSLGHHKDETANMILY